MSWFDEQIKIRKQNDEKAFEGAFLDVASAILGSEENRRLDDKYIITKQAIDEILKFYHFKIVEIPKSIKDGMQQLDYALQPHGIMHRRVTLTKGWFEDAYGPMIGYMKEGHTPVALIPTGLSGYSYHDHATGRKIKISVFNENLFDKDAICFYRPFPQRQLKVHDLVVYLKDCLHPRDIGLMALSVFAVTLVGMLEPVLSAYLTGIVLNSGSRSALVGTAIFLIAAVLSSKLLTIVNNLYTVRLSIETDLSVEAAMMMRILSLPASFFRKYSAGEMASRSKAVNELCNMIIIMAIRGELFALMSLIYVFEIFHYAASLVVPSMIILMVSLICSVVSTLMRMKITREIMEHEAKETGLAFALISGIQKIRLSGSEKRAFAKWAKGYAQKAKAEYNPPIFVKVDSVVNAGIGLIGTIIIYLIAVENNVNVSEYIGFSVAYGMTYGAFAQLASVVQSIAKIKPIVEMAMPFLEAEPEINEEKIEVTRASGAIELSHVSFRYNDAMPYVFRDLSLTIHSGEYVGIVGETGCGKTTLMRLLLGFEKPDNGAIYYDGKDMQTLDLRSLRKNIGTVMQNSGLIQGDLYQNIAISNPMMTVSEAWEAAEIAGIADDIRKMPMGMNTFVSEGGGGISGGQRQRIMIARAIANKPKILILDEATSALDNKTQKQVSDSLDKLECTRIVIAHRLSTIKNCNRIIVIDSGKIVEEGTFDSLIKKDGFFAQLVKRQLAG